ncbi:MAG: class I SAM-dependent methyltransferase [Actinomycetota bacterium]
MFNRSPHLYDALYSWKDYEGEAQRIVELAAALHPGARTLLDVACGTGRHLELLQESFEVEGLDLDAQFLDIAARRVPGVPLHQADMVSFDLGKTFDIVLCLFSSIGYMETPDRLGRSCERLARHVAPGGLLMVEPWLMPDIYEEGHIGLLTVDKPHLKIARMDSSKRDGDVSVLDFEYLVGTSDGVEYFTEQHRLGLFSDDQYRAALTKAGLELSDAADLMGRGLYVARKPHG